jgi:hypothetical protein
MKEITHIKGSKVTPYKQRMYKMRMIGYGDNYGLISEDKLSTITPPIQGVVEYSHTRTIHYLNEDSFFQSPTAPTTTLEELELPFNE